MSLSIPRELWHNTIVANGATWGVVLQHDSFDLVTRAMSATADVIYGPVWPKVLAFVDGITKHPCKITTTL
jgi:hypothetical protein